MKKIEVHTNGLGIVEGNEMTTEEFKLEVKANG